MYKWVLLAINLGLFIGLMACGGPTTASETRHQAAKASSVGIATEIEFIAGDGTITGPSTSKSGWVRFTLKNDSSSIANMALVNLGSGNSVESLSSHVSQNKALPDWAYPSAGIADTATGSTANQKRFVLASQTLVEDDILSIGTVLHDAVALNGGTIKDTASGTINSQRNLLAAVRVTATVTA